MCFSDSAALKCLILFIYLDYIVLLFITGSYWKIDVIEVTGISNALAINSF